MRFIGKDPERDEREFIQEFFVSLSMSERRRMFAFFKNQVQGTPADKDWSHKPKEGTLLTPGVKAASNHS